MNIYGEYARELNEKLERMTTRELLGKVIFYWAVVVMFAFIASILIKSLIESKEPFVWVVILLVFFSSFMVAFSNSEMGYISRKSASIIKMRRMISKINKSIEKSKKSAS